MSWLPKRDVWHYEGVFITGDWLCELFDWKVQFCYRELVSEKWYEREDPYSPIRQQGLASEDLCNRCPVGRTGRAPGLTSAAACHPVPAGSFASTENGQEMKCEPGTYQDEEGQSSCKRCPTGKHGLAVDIPNDVAIACENCPAGRYSGAKGIPNAEGCVPCPAGTLGSTSGAGR